MSDTNMGETILPLHCRVSGSAERLERKPTQTKTGMENIMRKDSSVTASTGAAR